MPRGFQRLETSAGTRYVYQYTHPITGKRCRFIGETVRDCEDQAAKIRAARARLRNGVPVAAVRADLPQAADPERLTLRQAWERYLCTLRTRARAKAEQYWRTTIDVGGLGDRVVCELDSVVLGEWAARLSASGGRTGQGRAPATIRLAFDFVAACLSRLGVEPGWGSWRPPVPESQQIRRWARSLDELGELLRTAQRADERDWSRGRYAIRCWSIAFDALTGLRNAELAALGWDDLELDDEGPARMTVRHSAPKRWPLETPGRPKCWRKNRKILRQQLHPTAVAALRAQRAQLERLGLYRPDGPVWPTARGAWRTSGRVIESGALRRLVATAGLSHPDEWVAHSLRHTMASLELVASGGDLRGTASRTGHHDMRALTAYVHQMGTGLGASRVPELAIPDRPVLAALSGGPHGEGSGDDEPFDPSRPEHLAIRGPEPDPWELTPAAEPPPLSRTWDGAIEHATAAARVARQRRQDESRRPFDELAAEWLACPERDAHNRRLPRPRAVTDAARRNGAAAYQRAKYAGQALADCRLAWRRAKAATLGAWAKALKGAQKRLESSRFVAHET